MQVIVKLKEDSVTFKIGEVYISNCELSYLPLLLIFWITQILFCKGASKTSVFSEVLSSTS